MNRIVLWAGLFASIVVLAWCFAKALVEEVPRIVVEELR